MNIRKLLKFATIYERMVKNSADVLPDLFNPNQQSAPQDVKPGEEKPETPHVPQPEKPEKPKMPEVDMAEQEELGYSGGGNLITDPKTPKEKKMQKVQQEGKKIGKVSWQLGNEFVLGNRYRTTAFVPVVVPRKKVDMHSAAAKSQIVDIIINLIKTDNYFAGLRSAEAATNFISNLMGMKKIEGSASNYNFGNIQIGESAVPNQYWNTVFLMGDYNYSPGGNVPYVELWRSYDNLKNGATDWILFMKKGGFLDAAKTDAKSFYEGLRSKGYFGKTYQKTRVEKHEKDYIGGIMAGRKSEEKVIREKALAAFAQ